jgi:hypothetical protein
MNHGEEPHLQHVREARKGRQVAAAAKRIVDGARRTFYQHGIIVESSTGTYLTDCSGFVSYVLEGVAPEHYGAIPRSVAHPYPRAFEFFDYFVSRAVDASLGWQRIDRFCEAREGDVVAWRKERIEPNEDSGHVFVVAEAPALVTAGVWAIRAYDSSALQHFDDSRERNGAFLSGVGTGTILVHVDARGRACGFQFGPGDSLHEAPIATARLEPLGPNRGDES